MSLGKIRVFLKMCLFIWRVSLQSLEIKAEAEKVEAGSAPWWALKQPGLGQSEARSQGAHMSLQDGWQSTKNLGHHLLYPSTC